jgi:hypothetical protein
VTITAVMIGLLLATQLATASPSSTPSAGASSATAPATAALAPGSYTYKALLSGANVGTSTVQVKSDGGITEIDERATGSYQGESGSGTAKLLLDATLAPTTYQATGSFAGSPTKDGATMQGSTANVTTPRGETTAIPLLASTKHFVVIDLGTISGFIPLAAQMKAWGNTPALAVVPSFGKSLTIIPADPSSSSRPSTVPATDAEISFTGQAPFTIWYNPTTYVPDEIDVTAQGLQLIRTQ